MMDIATKIGADAEKLLLKKLFKKLKKQLEIWLEIADRITSLGKPKEKTKKVEEIYIPPEKWQQIIDDFKLFWA